MMKTNDQYRRRFIHSPRLDNTDERVREMQFHAAMEDALRKHGGYAREFANTIPKRAERQPPDAFAWVHEEQPVKPAEIRRERLKMVGYIALAFVLALLIYWCIDAGFRAELEGVMQ
jgi:hypothetical protein